MASPDLPTRGHLSVTWIVVVVGGLAVAVPAQGEQSGWSPDSGDLAYTANVDGNTDLWLQRGSGVEAVRVTTDSARDHFASWFPDGEHLAFQSLREGQREIYRISVDGSGATNLTRHQAQDLLPDVSSDGTRIVFFSDRGLDHGSRELPGHLWLMASDGSGIRGALFTRRSPHSLSCCSGEW